MGLSGGGMLLGVRCGLLLLNGWGWGERWRSDEVAAAWRRGWNLLVILDLFRGIFYFWRNNFG